MKRDLLKEEFFIEFNEAGQFVSVARGEEYCERFKLAEAYRQIFGSIFKSNFLPKNPYYQFSPVLSEFKRRVQLEQSYNYAEQLLPKLQPETQFKANIDQLDLGTTRLFGLKFYLNKKLINPGITELIGQANKLEVDDGLKHYTLYSGLGLFNKNVVKNCNYLPNYFVVTKIIAEPNLVEAQDLLSRRLVQVVKKMMAQGIVLQKLTLVKQNYEKVRLRTNTIGQVKDLSQVCRSAKLKVLSRTEGATYRYVIKYELMANETYADHVYFGFMRSADEFNELLVKSQFSSSNFQRALGNSLARSAEYGYCTYTVYYLFFSTFATDVTQTADVLASILSILRGDRLRALNLGYKAKWLCGFMAGTGSLKDSSQFILGLYSEFQNEVQELLQTVRDGYFLPLGMEFRAVILQTRAVVGGKRSLEHPVVISDVLVRVLQYSGALLRSLEKGRIEEYLCSRQSGMLTRLQKLVERVPWAEEWLRVFLFREGLNLDREVSAVKAEFNKGEDEISDEVLILYAKYFKLDSLFELTREFLFKKPPANPLAYLEGWAHFESQAVLLRERRTLPLTRLNGVSIAIQDHDLPCWQLKLPAGKSLVGFMDCLLLCPINEAIKHIEYTYFFDQAVKELGVVKGYSVSVVSSMPVVTFLRRNQFSKALPSHVSMNLDVVVRGSQQDTINRLFYDLLAQLHRILKEYQHATFAGYFNEDMQGKPYFKRLPSYTEFMNFFEMTSVTNLAFVLEEEDTIRLVSFSLNLLSVKERSGTMVSVKDLNHPGSYFRVFFKKLDFSLYFELVKPTRFKYVPLPSTLMNFDSVLHQVLYHGLSQIKGVQKVAEVPALNYIDYKTQRLLYYHGELLAFAVLLDLRAQSEHKDPTSIVLNLQIFLQEVSKDLAQSEFNQLRGLSLIILKSVSTMVRLSASLANDKHEVKLLTKMKELALNALKAVRTLIWHDSLLFLHSLKNSQRPAS